MRALLYAALLTQAIAFPPATATEGSLQAGFQTSGTAELETAFWVCDYAGTNGAVGAEYAAACIAITDELKRKKFDGDFDRLVTWWKLHKATRHQELERVSTAAHARRGSNGAS